MVAVEEEGAEEVAGVVWGKAFALLLIPLVVEEEEEEEEVGLGEAAAEGGEVVAGVDDDCGAAIWTTAQAATVCQHNRPGYEPLVLIFVPVLFVGA